MDRNLRDECNPSSTLNQAKTSPLQSVACACVDPAERCGVCAARVAFRTPSTLGLFVCVRSRDTARCKVHAHRVRLLNVRNDFGDSPAQIPVCCSVRNANSRHCCRTGHVRQIVLARSAVGRSPWSGNQRSTSVVAQAASLTQGSGRRLLSVYTRNVMLLPPDF